MEAEREDSKGFAFTMLSLKFLLNGDVEQTDG